MKRNLVVIATISGLTLSGCSTLQSLNPFKSSKAIKAPCKLAAIGDIKIKCVTKDINLDRPGIEELEELKLRGPYQFL